MGSKSPPDPPNPAQLATAQTAASVEAAQEQARLNRLNQTTPLGSVTFQETGEEFAPFERITELTPTGQSTFDQQQQLGFLNRTTESNDKLKICEYKMCSISKSQAKETASPAST